MKPSRQIIGMLRSALLLSLLGACAGAQVQQQRFEPVTAPRPLGSVCSVSPTIFGARTSAHRLLLLHPSSPGYSLGPDVQEVLRQAFRDPGRSAAWVQAGVPQTVHIATVPCAADAEGAAWSVGLATGADSVLWAQVKPPAGNQPGWLYLHLTAVAVLGGRTTHLPPIAFWPPPPSVRRVTNNGPIGPGPFDPGGQPVPCYIGNVVHEAIAVVYAQAHIGQDLYVNHIPISGILQRSRITPPSGISPTALAVKPDITNMTRRDLYEIKPTNLVAQGLTEVMLYQRYFQQAGVPMKLGSSAEPGTSGVVPAPGGYAVFWVAVPGVIVYRCGRGTYEPEPVTAPVRERDPNILWRQLVINLVLLPAPTWQTTDLITPIKAATGLTGISLMTYIVFSLGTRAAFPLRNFVPIP